MDNISQMGHEGLWQGSFLYEIEVIYIVNLEAVGLNGIVRMDVLGKHGRLQVILNALNETLAGAVDGNGIGRIYYVLGKVVEDGSCPGLYGAIVEFVFKGGFHFCPDALHLADCAFHLGVYGGSGVLRRHRNGVTTAGSCRAGGM